MSDKPGSSWRTFTSVQVGRVRSRRVEPPEGGSPKTTCEADRFHHCSVTSLARHPRESVDVTRPNAGRRASHPPGAYQPLKGVNSKSTGPMRSPKSRAGSRRWRPTEWRKFDRSVVNRAYKGPCPRRKQGPLYGKGDYFRSFSISSLYFFSMTWRFFFSVLVSSSPALKSRSRNFILRSFS